jgi:hypothetical protein
MPSSPGYVRDLKQEYKTAKARGEIGTGHNSKNAERHRARRLALKKGLVKPARTGTTSSRSARADPTSSAIPRALAACEPRLPAQP